MKFLIWNKKGQEEEGGFSTAIWLAIIVVALIIFVPFIYKQETFASQLSETAACYASIAGSIFSSEESVAKCPIRDYNVYNNIVKETKDGKTKDSDIVKDFSATDDKVYELFAKLMGSCLQMGGGVNSNAFGRRWLSSSTVCLECSNVKFDNEITQPAFGVLRDYLEKTNVPGKDKKYAELFTKNQQHKEDWVNYGVANGLIPGKITDLIEKKNIYTIFFIGIKEGTASAIAFNWRLIGREDTYFVYAAPQENFNKICDRKVN